MFTLRGLRKQICFVTQQMIKKVDRKKTTELDVTYV